MKPFIELMIVHPKTINLTDKKEKGFFLVVPFDITKPSKYQRVLFVYCGKEGIRTPETLLAFTRFPGDIP